MRATSPLDRLAVFLLLLLPNVGGAQPAAPGQSPTLTRVASRSSPDGQLVATFARDPAGALYYDLTLDGDTPIVEPSRLGLVTRLGPLVDSLTVRGVDTSAGRTSYRLASGKQLDVDKPHRGLTLRLGADRDRRTASVEALLFDDGLAFRYVLGEGYGDDPVVLDELTEFVLPEGLSTWRQSYAQATRTAPAYEEPWERADVSAPAPTVRGLVLPLYAYDARRHVLLHEGPVTDYFGSHLDTDGRRYRLVGPLPTDAGGLYDTLGLLGRDRATPWRLVVVGDEPGDVAASTLVTDVAPPRAELDFGYVEPGRATWSWWSDWDSPRDYDKLARFVDFGAEHGWRYSLVDANWNVMEGGSLEGLAAYAKTKGVGLLVWYNSGGAHNDVTEQPRNRMFEPDLRRREMAMLRDLGVAGIKVDFFQSDKRAIMRQYEGILADAAEFGLLVNFHGCTIPRGLRRTYPNLMTAEAVMGAENYEYNDDYPAAAPPQHTVLPLTRNVVGPMDYTPVTFTDRSKPRLTTDAHELALAILFESGIQHFADDADAYRALPNYAGEFLDEVPVAWDELRYLGGVPGEWIALARRRGGDWYFAAVNGGAYAREVEVDLSGLGVGPFSLIEDEGPRELALGEAAVGTSVVLRLRGYGGVVGWRP